MTATIIITTAIGSVVGGRVQRQRVQKLMHIPKEQYQFGKFAMGTKRRVRSLMYDEGLRTRAKVWLRILYIHSKSKKGEANFKAAHSNLNFLVGSE